jgi:hypothetical protein
LGIRVRIHTKSMTTRQRLSWSSNGGLRKRRLWRS